MSEPVLLAVEAVHGFNGYSIAILLHILLFAYWLGGDLGVFYSSRYILREELAPQARATALKIMHGVDLAPRICLVLFLPSGVTLMAWGPLGDEFFVNGFLLALLWVASLVWLAIAVYDYFRDTATRFGQVIQRLDLVVRYGLGASLLGDRRVHDGRQRAVRRGHEPEVARSQAGRVRPLHPGRRPHPLEAAPFGPAFGRLMATGSTPEVERDLRAFLRGCEPYVFAIWGFVLLAAVLGVIKPGSTAF